MTIAREKISLIHVAKARLGLDDETYRELLRNVAGVESSRDLDDAGFSALMVHFQRLGFQSDFGRRNIGDRAGMASPAQVEKIRALWSDYTSGEGDESSLGKWLDRQFKVSAVRFLDSATAHKAVGALSVMVAQRAGRGGSRHAS